MTAAAFIVTHSVASAGATYTHVSFLTQAGRGGRRLRGEARYCYPNTERRPRFILLARVDSVFSRSFDVG